MNRNAGEPISKAAWSALAIGALSTFLVIVDVSAVSVAFPSMQDDFGSTRSELGWVLSSYNVTVGALLLVAGRFADSFGRRRVFLFGIGLFLVGSALSALAGTVPALVAARVLQAIGGAIISGSAFAVVLPEFPENRRGLALGVAGASGALGAVLGPIIGSILIEAFSWRAVFWLNVPVCAAVLWFAPRMMRESSDPEATGRVDMVGVATGVASVGLILLAIVQTEEWGLRDARTIVVCLGGTALLPILIRRSRTHPEPLLHLSLFRDVAFRASNVANLFYGFGLTAGFLVNSVLLQDLWQTNLRTTGLALAPTPLVTAIVSILSGRVVDRIGYRRVIAFGAVVCSIGYALSAIVLDENQSLLLRFVPLGVLIGIGMGLTVAAYTSAALVSTPQTQFGVALAVCNSIRQVGYALGVAVVLVLLGVGAADTIEGFRWAWAFVASAFMTSGIAIAALYPSRESSAVAEATAV